MEAFWDIAFDDFDHTAFDRFEGIGDDGIDWKEDFLAGFLRVFDAAEGIFELVILNWAIADVLAKGLLEGIGHGSADDELIALFEEGVDDFDLVGDLESAEDRDIWTVFFGDFDATGEVIDHFDATGEVIDLFDHEVAFGDWFAFCLENRWNTNGGGVGAVGGTEGIEDISIREGGPFLGKSFVVLFFALFITGVLDNKDFAIL